MSDYVACLLMRIFFWLLFAPLMLQAQSDSLLQRSPRDGSLILTQAGASHLARLAYDCLTQPYPNKLSHVLQGDADAQTPQQLHPAFYGCFDWHSAVHGHWMLVHLLFAYPDLPEAQAIRQRLHETLTPERIAGEVAYFGAAGRAAFERMYGWAWLLKLAEALHHHRLDDADARGWSDAIAPLADLIVQRYLAFLPKQTYPIRVGEHSNTAFGLSFAWDYAQATGQAALRDLIRARAQAYYGLDVNCPASWEPGGADFLSPCLEEAALMQRVLPPEAFAAWFDRFLPTLPPSLRQPAAVTDRSDGKLVHLDGLNLSRAWCLRQIAQGLPQADPRRGTILAVANQHIEATLPNLANDDYAGAHWLGTFAVYALIP